MGSTTSGLFFGGRVETGTRSGDEVVRPRASGAGGAPSEAATPAWVRVESGRIADLGAGAPPHFEGPRFDLAGRTLAPAFVDAHVHLSWLATSLLGPDLSACDGVGAVLEAVHAWRGPGRGAGGEWIVGTGIDESAWRDRRLPTRAELDRIESRRPVLLQRVCGHVGVANSAALAHAVPGPHTDVESGRLAEDDLYVLNDRVRPDAADLAAVLPGVFARLHREGIVAVHDVSAPDMVRALAQVKVAHDAAMRVTCSVPARFFSDPGHARAAGASAAAAPRDAGEFFAARGLGDMPLGDAGSLHRVLGIKLFLDGSLGARTAFLRDPYADAPETCGSSLYALEDLRVLVDSADNVGLQLMVHAIGDAALDQALAALESRTRNGNPLRHRIEHAEVTPPDLVRRLAESGVWVCAQPNFAGRWSIPGGMNEQRLGARLAHCNVYRTLLEGGVPLAFGSDCMPLGPLYGLRSAIEHPLAQERLDPSTALDLYARKPASLAGRTGEGAIVRGARADLVVLAGPAPVAPGGAVWDRVDATFAGGRLVHGSIA